MTCKICSLCLTTLVIKFPTKGRRRRHWTLKNNCSRLKKDPLEAAACSWFFVTQFWSRINVRKIVGSNPIHNSNRSDVSVIPIPSLNRLPHVLYIQPVTMQLYYVKSMHAQKANEAYKGFSLGPPTPPRRNLVSLFETKFIL